jgi:hypothetical protein
MGKEFWIDYAKQLGIIFLLIIAVASLLYVYAYAFWMLYLLIGIAFGWCITDEVKYLASLKKFKDKYEWK